MFNVISISKAASSKESNPVPSPIKRRRSWSADRRVWTVLRREREPMLTLELENTPASRIGRINRAGKSSGTSTTIVCVKYGAQASSLKRPDKESGVAIQYCGVGDALNSIHASGRDT